MGNQKTMKEKTGWLRTLCMVLCLMALVACSLNFAKAEPVTGEVSFEKLHFRLPEGCTFVRESNSILEHGSIIGGAAGYPAPADLTRWDWAKQLHFPEWQDCNLGWFSDGGPGQVSSVEFFSDVPPGKKQTLSTIHHLFWDEGRVYDLWFDRLAAGEGVEDTILASASLGAARPELPYSIGPLPEGIGILRTVGGGILFEDGSQIVGGLTGYPIPEGVYDPYDAWFLWLEDVGIPDFSDDSLFFEGGITAGDTGWRVTFSELATGNRRTHVFHPVGEQVYDFWWEESLLTEQTQAALCSAVRFQAPDVPAAAEETDADKAYGRCHAIMEEVQAGSSQIRSQCVYADGSEVTLEEYWSETGMLSIRRSPSGVEGVLMAEDRLFTSQDAELTWVETAEDYEHTGPWLASFVFVKRNVTWLDTYSDGQTEEIAFLINYPFSEDPGTANSYFATFVFDAAGNFREVRLEVGMLEEETRIITETLVTLEDDAISAEILREYGRTN